IDMSITNRQPESPSVSRILEPLGKNLFYLSSVKYDTDLNANSSTNFEPGSTRQEFLTADIIVDKLGDPYGLAVNPNTNMIYLANSQSNTVSVIDGKTNTVIQ